MSLLSLPDEVLEQIFIKKGIRAQEVKSLSLTCKIFRNIVQRSAAIWRRLFTVHFSEIALELEPLVEGTPHEFWRREFVARFQLGRKVKEVIRDMSPKHYHRHAMSNVHIEHILDLPSSHDLDGLLLINAIQEIVNESDPDRDLTLKYYGKQAGQFVRHFFLVNKWQSFIEKSPQEQSYYDGLVMISQWFQPLQSISMERVKIDVLQIALAVVQKIKDTQPDHPINQLSHDETLIFNDQALTSDRFSPKCSLKTLDALNETFFNDLGFRGNTANYYNPDNSYIDKVLENRQGIPISLCLLYSLVARKLGVVILPINFPRHFILRWEDSEATQMEKKYLYVDVFQQGLRRTANEIRATTDNNPNVFETAKPFEVFQRMVRNLVTSAQIQDNEFMGPPQMSPSSLLRTALELTKVIGGDFEYPGFALCQIYLQMGINHREIIKELDNYESWPANMWVMGDNEHLKNQIRGLRRLCMSQIEDECAEREESEPKSRSAFNEVYNEADLSNMSCYAVGMVMKHRRYNYHCVIFGWDPICKATSHWIHQMGVNKLPRREKQPFYNVLVEDGSIRYAADENLELTKPRRIDHQALGRYFKHFHTDIGYEPNDELIREYPEDNPVRERLYLSFDSE